MYGAWRVDFTEIEFGWGDRPDGRAYSFNKEALQAEADRRASYRGQYHAVRADRLEFVPITLEFHKELLEKTIIDVNVGKHTGDLTRL